MRWNGLCVFVSNWGRICEEKSTFSKVCARKEKLLVNVRHSFVPFIQGSTVEPNFLVYTACGFTTNSVVTPLCDGHAYVRPRRLLHAPL